MRVWLCCLFLAMGLGCGQQPEAVKLVPLQAFDSSVGEERVGDFSSFQVPRVDILFIVDSSGSMGTHQDRLASNIDLFIDELEKLSEIDYHIAVTTSGDSTHSLSTQTMPLGALFKTDPNEPGYISRDTPGGLDILRKKIKVGTNGAGQERFFDPMLAAISQPLVNSADHAGFLRPEAYFSPIFITDTEDIYSSLPWDRALQELIAIKGDSRLIVPYGAIIPVALGPSTSDCGRDSEGPPKSLEAFIADGGGTFFNLCDDSFGTELARVAEDLVTRVGGSTTLADVPVMGTIEVWVGNQQLPEDQRTGWIYEVENNSIALGPEVDFSSFPEGAELRVRYQKANQFRK